MAQRESSRWDRPGIPLLEQILIWICGCFALTLVLTDMAGTNQEEFKVVPEFAVTLSRALGVVLVGFGLYHGVVALASRRPALSTGIFVVPFVGLLSWAAPFLVEVAFN